MRPVPAMGDRRITRLDSLRALGALAVAAFHVRPPHFGRPFDEPFWGTVFTVFSPGSAGVNLFFVLSGFVLFLSLERGPQAPAVSAYRFLIARAFRIFPAVIFMAVIFTVAFGHTLQEFWGQATLTDFAMNGVTWTLQIEVVVAPFIVALYFLSRSLGPVVIIVAFVALTGLSFSGAWSRSLMSYGIAPIGQCFAFVAGMLVACFKDEIATRLARGGTTLVLLTGYALVLLWRPFMHGALWSHVAEVIGSALIIAAVSYGKDSVWARWLDAAWLRFYGRISYSLYLFHPLLLVLAWSYGREWYDAGYSGSLIATVLFVTTVALITPLAWFSYVFVEKSGIRMGRAVLDLTLPKVRAREVL